MLFDVLRCCNLRDDEVTVRRGENLLLLSPKIVLGKGF